MEFHMAPKDRPSSANDPPNMKKHASASASASATPPHHSHLGRKRAERRKQRALPLTTTAPRHFDSRAALTYDRRRSSRACTVCRARKTRCDGQRPQCGFCTSAGGQCDYSEPETVRFDQASLTILDRISQLEQKIDDGFTKLQRQTALNSSSQEDHGNRLSPRGDASFSPLRDAPHGGDVLTHSMLENGAQSRHESAPKTMDGPPSSDVILMASHFTVESVLRWPIFTQIFPELEGLIAASPTELIGNSKHVNPRIGDVTKSVQASLLGCEPKSLEGLVQNFIKSNYGKNPIFDIDALCLEARRVEEHGISWDAGSCLILLVCAISIISTSITDVSCDRVPYPSADRMSAGEAYFQASQRRIGVMYLENALVTTQCSFLTGVYLMSTMRIMAAWKAFAQAGTQCLGYLISRGRFCTPAAGTDGSLPPVPPVNDLQEDSLAQRKLQAIEECLYWSCLKSELELRIELSLSGSGLNEQNYPNLFPCPPDMGRRSMFSLDIYSEDESQPQQHQHERLSNTYLYENGSDCIEDGWFFYLSEVALRRIVNRALLSRHHLAATYSAQGLNIMQEVRDEELQKTVNEFDLQIQEWFRSLPPQMSFSQSPSPEPTGNILQFVLRGHMIDIIEMIRFPAIHTLFYDNISGNKHMSNNDISNTVDPRTCKDAYNVPFDFEFDFQSQPSHRNGYNDYNPDHSSLHRYRNTNDVPLNTASPQNHPSHRESQSSLHLMPLHQTPFPSSLHCNPVQMSVSFSSSPTQTTLKLSREMLANCVYRIETNMEGFLHRHQGTWLTIRSCSRSALMLLGVAAASSAANGRLVLGARTVTKASHNDGNGIGHGNGVDVETNRSSNIGRDRAPSNSDPMSIEMETGTAISTELRSMATEMNELLPPRWREAVIAVFEMLDVWACESADITRLRDIIGLLLRII